jgi:hypothetical protein
MDRGADVLGDAVAQAFLEHGALSTREQIRVAIDPPIHGFLDLAVPFFWNRLAVAARGLNRIKE